MFRHKKYSIQNILSFLEDTRYPSVGPHLNLLSFIGLWHRNINSKVTRFKQFIFYTTIAFFFSQYVKCIIKFNTDSLKLILQYAPFHIGIIKSCFFQKDYKNWKRIIEYISILERKQLEQEDEKQDNIIKDYIKRNRRVSYFFWTLAFFSNFSIFTEPYQKNEINVNGTSIYLNIFDGYTPFDKEPPGYYASMFIQTILGYTVSAYVVAWDTLVVSIMIFFAGQLRVTRLHCSAMIVGDLRKCHENIARCHYFHTSLVKYHKMFNSLISPVMFVYQIIIAVNLGVCIIQMAQRRNEAQEVARIKMTIHNDIQALASSLIFLIACLIQLLLFYWYSNEVTVESMSVSYSSFESDWPELNNNLKREVALLGVTTMKKFVFNAGPFNKMSLATFIGILRASYSFYTLLNSKNLQYA